MASACIRPVNINSNHRSNNLNLSSLQNNQNFIIISQSNFNQITQQQGNTSISSSSSPSTTTTTIPVDSITSQKLKNLAIIAPAPSSTSSIASTITTTTTHSNSILGMNSINIQSNQSSNPIIMHQQTNNCGIGGSGNNTTAANIYKKKYTYANIPYGTELPPSVARRNARERNRVKQVNNGYANLRQHIPQTIINALTNGGRGASKKLSKVDTLRLAVEYIRRLQDVLLIDDNISDDIGSDGGSLYSNSSNISSSGSSITDCESNSPQSTTYYHNVDSPLNNNNHHHNNINGSLSTVQTTTQLPNHSDNGYMINHINYTDPSVSPAPSYTSDISIGSNHNHQQNNYLTQSPHLVENNHNQHQQFKFEPYDSGYNAITDTTPEDEELLDYISSWQEQ